MTREPLAVMAKPTIAPLQVVLIGTYPPRQCGIATFTRDLAEAVATPAPGGWPAAVGFARRARPTFEVSVVAIDSERRDFPAEVRRRLDPERPGDYLAVAGWLNHASIDAVSLQHEFGIYGGPDGERILALAGELDVPLVTTFHTVLQRPSPNQRRVVRTLAERSTRVVVLSNGAARTLREVYALDPARIAVVPHGVPDLPLVDPERVKPLVGLSGRPVVLSFGLLGPGKGYELAIRAMADVI
ncbi:MAG: glycosyltransferase, partial [Candidatus Limnocylindrales bacterium]